MQGGWWEWNGTMQTSIQYGPIDSKLTFDSKGGAITIEQVNSDLNAAAGEYAEAEVSLAKFGFGFDPEGICGVYYKTPKVLCPCGFDAIFPVNSRLYGNARQKQVFSRSVSIL